MCVISLALFALRRQDFFAIRKVTHMNEEILSRIVMKFPACGQRQKIALDRL
jgi:hypothetical protein